MNFQQIANGDHGAYEALFKEHYRPLCAFAFQYVKSSDDAEEVVQDLFVKLWQDRKKLNITSSLKAYLFTAVRNRSLNAINKLKRNEALSDEMVDIDQNLPTGQAGEVDEDEEEMRNARVRSAIEQLPEMRRKVFKMSRFDGLKYREIAEKLGISIKTVENQMGSALKTLRTELADMMPLLALFTIVWWWIKNSGLG